jgi:phosphoribosylanthranilate isomerase
MTKVKICGITNAEDARMAIKSGADFIGMIIDVPVDTPRKISLEEAVQISNSPSVNRHSDAIIVVLMPRSIEEVIKIAHNIMPWGIQLHGNVPNVFMNMIKSSLPYTKIIKTIHISLDGKIETDLCELNENVDFVLLDTEGGGTGITHDWSVSKRIKDEIDIPIILAGGLTPDNVATAIEIVNPYAVDVASGVESYPGKKDPQKMKAFIETVKCI